MAGPLESDELKELLSPTGVTAHKGLLGTGRAVLGPCMEHIRSKLVYAFWGLGRGFRSFSPSLLIR